MRFPTFLLPLAVLLAAFSCGKTPDEPADPEHVTLTVLDKAVSCWSDSEEGTVRFRSDGKWQAETDETWISVVTGSGRGSGEEQTLRFRLSPNQTDSDRTGILTLFTKDGYQTILVTQLSIADRSVSHHFRDVLAGDFSRVYICAHRANTYEGVYMTKDCPENSVPAIRKAIEKGLDMVELDVRQTKDGVLVCAHDDNLASVTTGSGSIAERYFSDIRQFDMKIRETGTVVKGVRMPRLSEALAAAKDRIWVNLDLDKTAIAAASVLKEVEKAGMLDQVTFFTGSDADLAKQYYEGSKGRISPHLSVTATGSAHSLDGIRTTPLMQINWQYYHGEKGTTALSSGLRSAGYVTFSNLLNFDEEVRKGKTGALDLFTAARIDYLQTDVGDLAVLQNYLKGRGLR